MIVAQQEPQPSSWRNVGRILTIVALSIAGIFVLRRIPLTLEILFFATLLSYGINPVILVLSKKLPRQAAIAMVFGAFIVILLALAAVVIPVVLGQLQNVLANSAGYLSSAQAWLAHEWTSINRNLGGHLSSAQTTSLSSQLFSNASGLLQSAFGGIGFALVSTVDTLIVVATAIVLSYYFLANGAAMKESFLSCFPQQRQADALRFTQEVERVFGGYISGQLILSSFCGVFTFLGLKLAHADYALLVGVLTALLYVIPYVGVPTAMLFGWLFGLLQSWEIALGSAVVIFVVTRISDTLLVPKVMSKSVGVSPMTILLAVFAGGELFGLWGLILAIPGAAMLKVLWITWLQPWLTGKPLSSSDAGVPGRPTDATSPKPSPT